MNLFNRAGRRRRAVERKRAVELGCERFEDRILLATFTVLVSGDNGDNTNPTPNSLRQAILTANQNTGATTTILFDIPSGPFTISPLAPLPPIQQPVLLDGTSQPGYVGAPIIQIDGATHSLGGDGLLLAAGSDTSRIRGLDLVGFASGAGIDVQSGNDVIQSNYLGTDVTGTAAGPGNQEGILISDSNNTIGGLTTSVANTIAFNSTDGVRVDTGTGNVIRQNAIFANGTLGIDLAAGANNNQPAPSLFNAFLAGPNSVTVQGQASGLAASTTATIEFFASGPNDPAGGDQAHIFVGSASVLSNGFFSATVTSAALTPGARITASLTTSANDTSEFSNSVTTTMNFMVTNVNDAGFGSLRQAILDADRFGKASTITFDIGSVSIGIAATPPVFVITLNNPLPAITVPTTIDGTSQPDYFFQFVPSGNGDTNHPIPVILIDGGTHNVPGDGLVLDTGSTGSTIKALSIFGFTSGAAVHIKSNDDTLTADWLGVQPTISGNIVSPNATGVLVDGAAGNTIGLGSLAVPPPSASYTAITVNGRNVISGNSTGGVVIQGASTSNLVQNDFIGTDPFGTVAIPNGGPGVLIDGSGTVGSGNTIGGTLIGAFNVISGNSRSQISQGGVVAESGVVIRNGAQGNVVQNSYIGVDATGGASLPNSGYGVELDGAGTTSNTIGASVTGLLNVISGNTQGGVIIQTGAAHNLIQGSIIGLDAAGKLALSNGGPGVTLDGATTTGNSVGGITPQLINVISGNSQSGVLIQNGATGNLVQNSVIGLDATGSNLITFSVGIVTFFGNAGDGVQIIGSNSNTVGGTVSGLVNVISGNTLNGVELISTDSTTIINSYIGTSATGANGTNVLGNQGDGILITDSNHTNVGFYSAGNGATVAAGNVISGNRQDGVHIGNSDHTADPSSATIIAYNKIGTDASGTFAIDNAGYGVFLDNVQSDPVIGTTTIGGLTDNAGHLLAGNLISGNKRGGITVDDRNLVGDIAGNLILGNFIGTNLGGVARLANTGDAIDLFSSSHDTIGGTIPGSGNLISGNNTGAGVSITGVGSVAIFGNKIGTDLSGTAPVGNITGIVVSSSSSVSIGSTAGVGGNLIAGNLSDGVQIQGGGSDTLVANTIGATVKGSLGNGGNGIELDDSWNNTIGGPVNLAGGVPGGTIASLGTDHNVIAGNGGDGILINTQTPSTLGANVVTGNLISGNRQDGVHIIIDLTGQTTLAEVSSNFIGTTLDGTSAFDTNGVPQGNGSNGIQLEQSAIVPDAVSPTPNPSAAASISGNVVEGSGLSGVDVQRFLQVSDQFTRVGFPLAHVAIEGNIIGLEKTGTQALTTVRSLPLGNVHDGVLLDNVVGVTVGGTTSALVPGAAPFRESNVLSGNLNRGVEVRGDLLATTSLPAPISGVFNVVAGNLIGTDITGRLAVDRTPNQGNLGNLGDGVFLFLAPPARIQDNVISNNRGAGIHAQLSMSSASFPDSPSLLIAANEIGTDLSGEAATDPNNPRVSLGNSTDGVFLDTITAGATIGGTGTAGNIISGNRTNGIDLLHSNGVRILNNRIGTNREGNNVPSVSDLGNAANGISINQSSGIIVGGLDVAGRNLISGNHADGILLMNDAEHNTISGNIIGADATGSAALGNSADGVLLLGVTPPGTGSTINGTVSGNTITSNTISGNSGNGIQIFGLGANANTVSGNVIGLGANNVPIPNLGDGVLLNGAGDGQAGDGNVIGGAGVGNVIAGNRLSGIEIANTTNGTPVAGNFIGTNAAGTPGIGNAAYGILVSASSANSIGGLTATPGTGLGNVISGNGKAGVLIFGPTLTTPAERNLVAGNLIGTSPSGTVGVGNSGDGLEIFNGSFNTIGGTTSAARNVISDNASNGVFIDQFPGLSAANNQVQGNAIGTDITGFAALANGGNGVLIMDGTNNTIGGTTVAAGAGLVGGTEVPTSIAGGAGNLISGNRQWGVQIEVSGSSMGSSNTVQGNYIGTDFQGLAAICNLLGGVVVTDSGTQSNTAIPQRIGGATPGAGNLISGNADVGIGLFGPQIPLNGATPTNVVQGNVIGLNTAGNVLGNATGILIENSPHNLIGGLTPRPGTGSGNVISGNGIDGSGIQVFGDPSTGNSIQGNAIGTDLSGERFPPNETEGTLSQFVGVLINGSSGNLVGGTEPGAANALSGNIIGVEIAGMTQSTGQIRGGGNLVQGNRIGTGASGMTPVSNLDFGVYINNSQSNTIGPGNVISANGIGGIEIFNKGSTQNLVVGNVIGLGIDGRRFPRHTSRYLVSVSPEPKIRVFPDAQLDGVVILGASQNTVGAVTGLSGSQANDVSGNIEVGLYLSSRDFGGRRFPVPVNNVVSGNTIQDDRLYGVLFYDAPNNTIRPFTSQNGHLIGNTFGRNQINFRNFFAGFDVLTLMQQARRATPRGQVRHATAHAAHPKVVHSRPIPVRPRVPTLFKPAGSPGQPNAQPMIVAALPPWAHTHHRRGD